VLSPSTAFKDRTLKRRRYQTAQVAEYWIVDLDARLVERWRPDDQRPEILTDRVEWQPVGSLPPLVMGLGDYFSEVWGEASPP
jgi:Uma2 family endonuclease